MASPIYECSHSDVELLTARLAMSAEWLADAGVSVECEELEAGWCRECERYLWREADRIAWTRITVPPSHI